VGIFYRCTLSHCLLSRPSLERTVSGNGSTLVSSVPKLRLALTEESRCSVENREPNVERRKKGKNNSRSSSLKYVFFGGAGLLFVITILLFGVAASIIFCPDSVLSRITLSFTVFNRRTGSARHYNQRTRVPRQHGRHARQFGRFTCANWGVP